MGWIQAPAVFVKCLNILPAGVKWSPTPPPPHPALFQRAGVRFLGGIGVFSLFTSSGRASLS